MEGGREALRNIRKKAEKRDRDMTLDEINEIISEVRKEKGYVY